MWSRKVFKNKAKFVLSKSYWMSFLVCLLSGAITGGMSLGYRFDRMPNRGSFSSGNYTGNIRNSLNLFHDAKFLLLFFGIAGIVFLIALAIGLVFYFFVISPVTVGKAKFFLESRKGSCEFTNLFYSFKNGQYINIVKTMAWRYLITFAWTLLFIIPGIIKSYAYSMVPYILANNPHLGHDRALKLSKDMTDGYKFKIFILQLSFIGWYLLGSICLVVGVFFVNPYCEATMAEMYGMLRKNAVEIGICHPNELNLTQEDFMADSQG